MFKRRNFRLRGILYTVLLMLEILSACGISRENEESDTLEAVETQETGKTEEYIMKISIKSEEYEIIYEMNHCQASKDLYAQLPLTVKVQDFSTNEKIFYPPEELNIDDAPLENAQKGSLCYYSPWADVVMFYEYFGKGSNLYTLGEAVSGKENIEKLSGMIEITAVKEENEIEQDTAGAEEN